MDHLEVEDLALVLGRPVMTARGRGILSRIKSSEMECDVTLDDTGQSKWFYAYQVQPILKPFGSMTEAHRKELDRLYPSADLKISVTRMSLWSIRKGYDPLNWIQDGFAILEDE